MFRNLTPQLMKAARSLLDWTQDDLAEASTLAPSSIRRFESKGLEKASIENVDKIVSALETAGVIFLAEGEVLTGGPGVRLNTISLEQQDVP